MTTSEFEPASASRLPRRGRIAELVETGGSGAFALSLFLPAFILVALVSFAPLGYAIVQSLHRSDFLDMGHFVGLANYADLLLTESGVNRAWNSFVFVSGTLLFSMPLGIGLALVLNGPVPFRGMIRTILIVPWLVSNIVGALLWAWILNAQFGPIAYAASLFGLTIPNAPTSLALAMPSVILVNVWSTYPLVMIFVLAALQTVPRELHEAASIDGATALQRFGAVTYPCIKNTLLVALVLTTLWSFNMVTIILVMTGGGPVGATDTMAFNIWEEGFRLYRMGMASAGAVIVFVINIAFAIAYMRVLREGRDRS